LDAPDNTKLHNSTASYVTQSAKIVRCVNTADF